MKPDTRLAIDGGQPVRRTILPYGHQWLDEEDIASVVEVLRSPWLTTGPKVDEFEQSFARFVGTREAVAVSSGTAALHSAMYALGIGPGDEVIVPAMTFAATANSVVFQGGTPVFADVDNDTLLLNSADVEAKITARTKAIIAVDYAGQPCNYDALRALASEHNLGLLADACHSLGASNGKKPVGTLADLTVFSFHPVKHITTGEGGMIVTDSREFAEKLRRFRNHGMSIDHHRRTDMSTWHYEMIDIGYNYRLTDFQCALGIKQLKKIPSWLGKRQLIANLYDEAFANLPTLTPLKTRKHVFHAYHLYVVCLNLSKLSVDRTKIFQALRTEGIGVNVHYIPVHLHPYYQRRFGTGPGLCPIAEDRYEEIITLPIYPKMTEDDVKDVIDAVTKVTNQYFAEHRT